MSRQVRNPLLIAIFATLMLSACSNRCVEVSNHIIISGWNGNIPKKVILYQYKKDSNFSTAVQKTDSDHDPVIIKIGKNSPSILNLDFKTYSALRVDYDYKLIVDDSEYRISKIVAGRSGAGCRIPSGKANQCNLIFDNALSFEASCGTRVTKGN